MRISLLTETSIFGLHRLRVAAVRFGPVQHDFLLNLKLDRWSGSANPLNLGPDLPEPVERVQRVRFKVQGRLDLKPDLRTYRNNELL